MASLFPEFAMLEYSDACTKKGRGETYPKGTKETGLTSYNLFIN